MVKRICPKCLARWYSSATADKAWLCAICKSEVPKSQEFGVGNKRCKDGK